MRYVIASNGSILEIVETFSPLVYTDFKSPCGLFRDPIGGAAATTLALVRLISMPFLFDLDRPCKTNRITSD